MAWKPESTRRALALLKRFGAPNRRLLWSGAAWTVVVVLSRLAMPWPLKGVVEHVFPEAPGGDAPLAGLVGTGGEALLWLLGAYVAVVACVGFSEMAQRVSMMRFASQTVHGIRGAVVRDVSRDTLRGYSTGELVSRMVGDSARLKSALNGILVHATQNGLLFAGICLVFLFVSPLLGLFFLIGGVLVVLIGVRTASPVAASAHKHRSTEGDYAVALQDALADDMLDADLEDLNLGSSDKDVKTTRMVTHATFLAHLVLAATVGLALFVGAQQVAAGLLLPGDIFLFIAYALIVHRRLVQVGRQLARSGKVMATANRLGDVLAEAAEPGTAPTTEVRGELLSGVELASVKLRSERGKADKPRLRRTDLVFRPGERVAVLGKSGAGKSSLLRLIAGVELPDRGSILWDGVVLDDGGRTLRTRVGYAPATPAFPVQPLWKSLGLSDAEAVDAAGEALLSDLGAWSFIRRMPKGLDTKAGSRELSVHEARLLKLAAVVLCEDRPVWALDDPFEGLGGRAARGSLDRLLASAGERTVVMALSKPVELERFDRVIGLRKGRVVYDGDPTGWLERKAEATPQPEVA